MTTHAENAHDRYQQHLAAIAQRLRDCADRIEQIGVPREDLQTLCLDRSYAARRVLKEVLWCVPNLHVEQLVAVATEADQAAEREAHQDALDTMADEVAEL